MTSTAPEVTFQEPEPFQARIVDMIEYDGITVRFEEVDDQLVGYWLDNYNTHNRKITETRVAGHVRDMLTDNWPITGDTIRFGAIPTEDGGTRPVMLDGQHRAEAIRRSKKSQVLLIVEGLHLDVREVIDTGKPRSFADLLTLKGISNGAMNSAITRRLAIYKRGAAPHSGGAASTPTKTELDEFFEAHKEDIFEATRLAYRVAKSTLDVPASVVASAYYLCAEKDAEAARVFFEDQLIDTRNIDTTDPAHRLRYRLENAKRDKLDGNTVFMFCVKGWGHARKGERIQTLQAPRNGWPTNVTELTIR